MVSLIEKGWERGVIPMSDEYIKEYIKAVGKINKIDHLDVKALLEYAQKKSDGNATEEFKISDFKSAVSEVPGTSPGNPLYIANGSEEGRGQKFKKVASFLFKVGAFLVAISLVGKLLDEKGPAGGLGMFKSIVHEAEDSDKTFDDVVGVDEAKADLQELVLYLKDPSKFTRLGGKLPKGILLTGPPGTGKTLIAKAIAGEAGVPFFYTSGSEFEEMYVGLGARRVRELFAAAKQRSPCIIFIDEIDAMGGSRNLKEQSAMKMTLNQLLVQMDGFEENNGVIVIGK